MAFVGCPDAFVAFACGFGDFVAPALAGAFVVFVGGFSDEVVVFVVFFVSLGLCGVRGVGAFAHGCFQCVGFGGRWGARAGLGPGVVGE